MPNTSTATTKEEWLASLKAGDEVARKLSGGFSRRIHADFLIVERTTARYVMVRGGQKFRKDNGREPGPYSSHMYYLAEPTVGLKAALAEQTRRDRLLSVIDKAVWRDQSTETLESVAELLNPKSAA